ncbi:hypothetical protein PC116_g14522 [Phytophthora cactorum]|uniref:Uncharacterized protein n=1 Tax=Phytophthora cactorum TaxID=29920 RepID=A0A8T1DEF0_9STRA|nr:hypothetical protein PC114_g11732 [Phytophthora cactorum]KAG2938173.1 hypothetical protein PC117_g11350 [Phytophthora cactorum]KAG3018164.1 hypothetical protein PC119_g10764 [Phytophthora cactorum]KAG3018820.1 hypothetical protein PC120_g10218 [Phytophthora cactorum]KAG3167816.1 hypothetical protein C6341_g11586 [Phytophthora cactorum]
MIPRYQPASADSVKIATPAQPKLFNAAWTAQGLSGSFSKSPLEVQEAPRPLLLA